MLRKEDRVKWFLQLTEFRHFTYTKCQIYIYYYSAFRVSNVSKLLYDNLLGNFLPTSLREAVKGCVYGKKDEC